MTARWFVERGKIPSTRQVSSMVMQFMAGILSEKKDNKFMDKLLKILQLGERGRGGISISVKCLVEYEDKDFAKKYHKETSPSIYD